MRRLGHSLLVALLALVATAVLAVTSTAYAAVTLAAVQTVQLLMGPTNSPNPTASYIQTVNENYVMPFYPLDPAAFTLVVTYPAQIFPVGRDGLDFSLATLDESVGQGVTNLEAAISQQPADQRNRINTYSQSTAVATIVKRNLIAEHGDDFTAYPDIDFILIANLNRPNGGILSRASFLPFAYTLPFFGITPNGATPTNSPANPNDPDDFALRTTDIAFQYDPVGDAPAYLNPLTLLNIVPGFQNNHPAERPPPELLYQGSKGDTDYYIVRSEYVPVLYLLRDLGVPRPVLLLLDAPLRVVTEATGYRRDLNPGEPVPWGLIPPINPVTFTVNLVASVVVGLDDAFEDMGGGRPLGTQPAGIFGVGGPALPDPPSNAATIGTIPAQPQALRADPITDSSDAATSRSNAPSDLADASTDSPDLPTRQSEAPTDSPDSPTPQSEAPTDSPDSPTRLDSDTAGEAGSPAATTAAVPRANRPGPQRPAIRGPAGVGAPNTKGPLQSGERKPEQTADGPTGQQPTTEAGDPGIGGGSPAVRAPVGDSSPDADPNAGGPAAEASRAAA